MKKLPRRPDVYDSLELFAALDEGKDDVPLDDPTRIDQVLDRIRGTLERTLQSPIQVHGRHTQGLFEAVVASLGHVGLIKTEDSGSLYYSGNDLQLPDYRIVLRDDSVLLVEVKNHKPNDPKDEFWLDLDYVERLQRYAAMPGGGALLIAVYWVQWNLWTLTPVDKMERREDRLYLSLPEASKANAMASLGDFFIATESPLVFRLLADRSKTTMFSDSGEAIFTVGAVEILAGDRIIESKEERQIAMWFLLYGGWPETEHVDVEGEVPIGITFEARPEMPAEGQEFQFLSPLSSMFSLYHHARTTKDRKVTALLTPVEPGQLGDLLPDGYSGSQLRIWRFSIQPT